MQRSTKLKIQSVFAEMVCTFIFGYSVYAAVLSVKSVDFPTSDLFIPLALGFGGIITIYACIDHTICHFNPAITLAAILTRKLPVLMGCCYLMAEFVGFILACCVIKVNFSMPWKETMVLIAPSRVDPDISHTSVFFTEFTLTAILVYVAFQVGVNAKRDPTISLYGDEPKVDRSIVAPLTIGLTLGLLGLLGATTSGGAFNPFLVLVPQILGDTWHTTWEYYVGDFAGGLFGGLLQVWLLYK